MNFELVVAVAIRLAVSALQSKHRSTSARDAAVICQALVDTTCTIRTSGTSSVRSALIHRGAGVTRSGVTPVAAVAVEKAVAAAGRGATQHHLDQGPAAGIEIARTDTANPTQPKYSRSSTLPLRPTLPFRRR